MKSIMYKGYSIEIKQDEYPENPRVSFDNMGIMVCSHRRYDLGDDDKNYTLEEVNEILANKDYIHLPIYIYDHSGITISTKPFSCPWDSGFLGIIYVTKARAEKELGYTVEQVKKILEEEVKEYDQYLTGDVWGYEIKYWNNNEIIDSCYGFYGYAYCEMSAKEAVDCLAEKKLKEFIPGLEPEELKGM